MDHADKKERRLRSTGAGNRMKQTVGAGTQPDVSPATEEGLSPNLQAHIGRHLRASFDEIAREPIPDRLLQLLKDLERSGDK